MTTQIPQSSIPIPVGHRPHLIPSWLVPLLSLPIRRIWDKPERLVSPLIKPGDRILELGPGSGFFTFPMAEAMGENGHLHCVELQEPVRRRLQRAISRRGLSSRIDVRACDSRDLQTRDLTESMDLVVAIDVLHEVPEPDGTIRQLAGCLRPGGRLLILEPRGHCPQAVFESEVASAIHAGLMQVLDDRYAQTRRHVALFKRS